MFAQPLKLSQGQWYEVGATEYGGPADPTAGTSGAISTPGQGYLPAHPDTFAELSVLDSNPANGGTFTFADANALNNLPVHDRADRRQQQHQEGALQARRRLRPGPRPVIANGQPYRLDVWWQSAGALGVSKNAVKIALAPPLGTAGVLGETPPAAPGAAGPNPSATSSPRPARCS